MTFYLSSYFGCHCHLQYQHRARHMEPNIFHPSRFDLQHMSHSPGDMKRTPAKKRFCFISTARAALVVLTVKGVSTIQSTPFTHYAHRSPAHSDSVLTFLNNIYLGIHANFNKWKKFE